MRATFSCFPGPVPRARWCEGALKRLRDAGTEGGILQKQHE